MYLIIIECSKPYYSFLTKKLRNTYLNNLLYLYDKQHITIMSKGTVKFFNESKGFGFVIDDESKQEYFVHVTGVIDEIREGDAVEFELAEGKKGLNAVNVKVL
jgi:CspA family cold shock protein